MKTRSRERPSIPWASGSGRDKFGLFADFRLKEVTQRLRWIPPGSFWMGSRENEPGRWPEEGPRHKVVFNAGYWLFDTPCTQALWDVVMEVNPSRFRSADRPVENVSFDEVATFLMRINRMAPTLELVLPSEAQWEYACRAGTSKATYAGDIKLLGQNNAPVLDAIAWYGGNSGDIEVAEACDSTLWLDKQYAHARAGTHSVGLKAPNAWGLYDMLGNVWEWCADVGRPTYEGAPGDGAPWLDGQGAAQYVTRGGSWSYEARNVRAASRWCEPPTYRHPVLGFRCARLSV
jgi:sulfatase modifying factor 1